MQTNPTLQRPRHAWLLREFIRWYFVERPLRIATMYRRYASALGDAFSFVFLIKSFVAPWKSIQDEYNMRGLNIGNLLQTLTLNITSRVIGMFFRLVAILTGIVIEVICAVIFAGYLLLWLLFPFLVPIAIVALPFWIP